MKRVRLRLFGLILLGLCGFLIWFAVSSYPQIKAVEERNLYLDGLDWAVGPVDHMYMEKMDYGSEYLICRQWENAADDNGSDVKFGVYTPECEEIVPCIYSQIFYRGGECFAALTKDECIVFNFEGQTITSMPRDDEHLAYAGGIWFIRYPDFEKWGFEIVDGMTGEVVQSFPNEYNGYRLPDGTWYISTTASFWGFRRALLSSEVYAMDTDYFEEAEVHQGYFLDENFKPLYGDARYRLVLTGDEGCIADQVIDGIVRDRAYLNKNGEQFGIEEFSPFFVAVDVAGSGDHRYGLTFDDEGNPGIIYDQYDDRFGSVGYFDREYGQELYTEESDKPGLIVNYNREGLYQITDTNKNVILEPWFHSIELLGQDYAYVAADDRCGIIDLRRLR